MNHVVAYELLTSELGDYRRLAFDELCELIGERSSRIVQGTDGVDYDLTVVVHWSESGAIRVRGFIGESNWGSSHDKLEDTFVVQRPSEPAGLGGTSLRNEGRGEVSSDSATPLASSGTCHPTYSLLVIPVRDAFLRRSGEYAENRLPRLSAVLSPGL